MKNIKNMFITVVAMIGLLSVQSSLATIPGPGLEIYNKASKPIAIALIINGKLTTANIGAYQKFAKTIGLNDTIRLGIADAQTKNSSSTFFPGALVLQPDKIYDFNAPTKTKYVTWDPAKSPSLYRQTGPLMGLFGYSDSGYSLGKNIEAFEIVPVSANQPIQQNVAPMPPVQPLPEITVKPVFTGGLTELAPTKPMKEEYSTSFSSTVGSIDQPVVNTQNVSLGATELGRGRLVQQTASIPVKLTLQSILDGALGEPYTSKANFINKTGYADSLNKDINRDINASYRPEYESNRIDSIKRTIDKLYTFASR